MGAKRRVLALLTAVIMILSSAACVFADDTSSPQGGGTALKTKGSVSKRVITVNVDNASYKLKGGKSFKAVKNGKITKLKVGSLVIIKNNDNTKEVAYRWLKTVKIRKNKNGKITWKKVKGATGYQIRYITKNGKVKTVKVSSKTLSKKLKKGYKVQVRPLKKSGNKTYMGVLCKKTTVK